MASLPRAATPAWTRRIQGWSFLVFFVSLIALTFAAVESYNSTDLVMSGYFAGLASVVPLFLVALTYYALPVWGISVPLSPDAVAGALAGVSEGQAVEPVAEREGPFARCAAVVRFAEPACTVGWSADAATAKASPPGTATVVVLRPESRDRKALAAFRNRLARSLLAALPPNA